MGVADLLHRVEDSSLSRIVAYASGVSILRESVGDSQATERRYLLPIAPIAANVVISKQTLIPLSANPPIDTQMLRKKTGYILAQAITRISREEQLPHTSIDESSPRRALEKAGHFLLHFRIFGGIIPRYGRFIFETFDPEETVPEFSSRESEVVTPEELEADGFRAFVFTLSIAVNAFAEGSGAVFEGEKVLMDLTGCDAAEGQPGRELSAEVFT